MGVTSLCTESQRELGTEGGSDSCTDPWEEPQYVTDPRTQLSELSAEGGGEPCIETWEESESVA